MMDALRLCVDWASQPDLFIWSLRSQRACGKALLYGAGVVQTEASSLFTNGAPSALRVTPKAPFVNYAIRRLVPRALAGHRRMRPCWSERAALSEQKIM